LLQEDTNTGEDPTLVRPSVNRSIPHVSTNIGNNWEIVADKSRKSSKLKKLNRALHEQLPIPVILITNHYNTLYNLQNNAESPSITLNHPAKYQRSRKNALSNKNKTRRPPIGKRRRILLTGDSHVRGCASELGQYLGQDYQVSGTFMPGSGLQNIVKLARNETASFTKKDLVIIWGGANDANRNKSMKGLKNLNEFVNLRNNTNFMIVTIPYRHDLLDTSCVNTEVKNFNAKLHKIMRNKSNVRILEHKTIREDFTQHGLHLIATSKNKVVKMMLQNISLLSASRKKHHIILGWTTTLHDTSAVSNTAAVQSEEHVVRSNDGAKDGQIASINHGMGTSNIDNCIPQVAEDEPFLNYKKEQYE
jgi:hypothetical protein